MNPPPPRWARIVLVTPGGGLLGALAAVKVATPWWQDIAPVVEAVRAAHGVRITVLRLLEVAAPDSSGIEITYLAETPDAAATEPWDGVLDGHPLRLNYARPGGPAADLAWAERVLSARGFVRDGPAIQVRTWNLSSLWRIPVRGETLWLKAVPPFFAHEGAVLQALAGGPVPTLLGSEPGRILMREVPGEDLYEAATPRLPPMVDLLVGLQHDWASRTDTLFALGLPDWRGPRLTQRIDDVVTRNTASLAPDDLTMLRRFVDDLPRRFADVEACGLPDTFVHGDFHPGNLRGGGNLRGDRDRLTVLDWGDCGVGHPLLDQPAFLGRIRADAVEICRRRWHDAWRSAAAGSDPDRASLLLGPVAVARQAVTYQGFLDHIEPSEHPYHRDDPGERLTVAAALLREES